MSRIEGVGDLDGQGENQVRLHRTVANAMLQRHTLEILHDDECSTALLINLMDRADVWVIERGRGFGFPLKAGQCLWVFGHIIRKEFERDKALEFNVVGLENDTHTATTEFLDNAIVGDGLVDHRAERNDGMAVMLRGRRGLVN